MTSEIWSSQWSAYSGSALAAMLKKLTSLMPASIISWTRAATRSGPPQTRAKSVTSSGMPWVSSSAFSLVTMLTLTSRPS